MYVFFLLGYFYVKYKVKKVNKFFYLEIGKDNKETLFLTKQIKKIKGELKLKKREFIKRVKQSKKDEIKKGNTISQLKSLKIEKEKKEKQINEEEKESSINKDIEIKKLIKIKKKRILKRKKYKKVTQKRRNFYWKEIKRRLIFRTKINNFIEMDIKTSLIGKVK